MFAIPKWQDALTTLAGDQGARSIISAHPEEVCQVAVESPELFLDVDTIEEYRRMTSLRFDFLAWENAAAELLDLPPFCAR